MRRHFFISKRRCTSPLTMMHQTSPGRKIFTKPSWFSKKSILSLQSQLKFFADYIVESEEKRNDRRRLKESETHQSVGLVSMMTDLAARVKVQEAHHNRGLVPVTADLPLKPPVKKGGIKVQNDGVVPTKVVKEKKARAPRQPKVKPMMVFDGPALPITRVPKKKRVVVKCSGKPESYMRQLFGSDYFHHKGFNFIVINCILTYFSAVILIQCGQIPISQWLLMSRKNQLLDRLPGSF